MKKNLTMILMCAVAVLLCACIKKESAAVNETENAVSPIEDPEWTKIENLREKFNSDIKYSTLDDLEIMNFVDNTYYCDIVYCITEDVFENEMFDIDPNYKYKLDGIYKYSYISPDVLKNLSEYKICIDVFHDDNFLFSFYDLDEYDDYYYDVLNPSFSKDNIFLIIGGIAAYRNIGFIENERFNSILEFSEEDTLEYENRESNILVTDYDIIFSDDEIRVLFYSYNPLDENSAEVHGYKCRMYVDNETSERKFQIEKVNLK
ncbi:MAG: hypothetical protein KBT21_05940 [Treponema sp.]|nr:hypothetical protein [Candidatus Treponema merdequi]